MQVIPLMKNPQIELYRFVAAVLVMGVHIPSIKMGHIGVDIFFIISGFVMMTSTQEDVNSFFLKRMIRVIPLYWFLTIILFLLALYLPSTLINAKPLLPDLLKSLFFIPFNRDGGGHSPLLFLGWTLNYEMYFYGIFFLSLKICKNYRGIIASSFIILFFIITTLLKEFPFVAYSNPILIEFILGMFLYELIYKKRALHIIFYVFFYFIPLFSGLCEDMRPYILGGTAFSLLFASLSFFRNIAIPPILIWGGQISYSFYLIHPYIISLLEREFFLFSEAWLRDMPVIILAFILTFLSASILFQFFEKPLTGYLRRKFCS